MAEDDLEQWLAELLDLIERSKREWETRETVRMGYGFTEAPDDFLADRTTDNVIQGRIHGFLRIAGQVAPGVAAKVDLTTNPSLWPWPDLSPSA